MPNEEASVRTRGMTYIHIPVDFDAPTENDFEQFQQTMDGLAGKKVHVHCIVNARVSAFFYRYRRDFRDVPEPVARAAMEEIWTPGGAWATFIGDCQAIDQPHRYRLSTR